MLMSRLETHLLAHLNLTSMGGGVMSGLSWPKVCRCYEDTEPQIDTDQRSVHQEDDDMQ